MDAKIKKLQEFINEQNTQIHQLTLSLEEERLKFKIELEAVHDYYDSIIALMPGHVYWLDRNNIFLGCNDLQAKNACLKSRKDIFGKTNSDMPWKDQADKLNKVNDLVMETGITQTTEEYAVMANGMGIYYSQKVPLRNKKNEIIGILGISLDITEQKKMEVALRRALEKAEVANQAKSEFIANMSHDLYTPLSGIVGMSKLLEEKALDPERKQFARWIHESGKQLIKLLNGVMDMAAADNLSESDVYEDLFDIRKNVQDIAHLVQPSLKMHQTQLNIEIDEATPDLVITDGVKLHRALLNLLGNAIKYTDSGIVTIKIEVLAIDNHYAQLRFSIIDTGMGIDPELQNKIFDRFYRSGEANENEHLGYGLGLHVAQKYLSLLGGEISLESEVGKGSTFYFVLTLKIEDRETHALMRSGEQSLEKEERIKQTQPSSLILLVENNIHSLHLLETVVEQAGYQFYSAIDGEHALELVDTTNFDFIITDAEICALPGKELVLCVRDLEKRKGKKPAVFIGLTTKVQDERKKQYFQLGMNKLLTRPINLKELLHVINEFSR